MIRKLSAAVLAVGLSAGPVLADWVFRAPAASDDLGSARVTNDQGHVLDIGCGNGGTIAISLRPDTRPDDLKFVDDGAVLFFRVDGGTPLQMPATCGTHGCDQDFMLGGEPWPVAQMLAITRALRAGSGVEVMLGGKVMSRFTLAGSSAALGRLKAGANCEGL